MRIFQTQSMWDAKEGRWYEVFSVDGEQVSGEEYFRELEVEQCLEDDEIDEYCNCCNCEQEDCKDFNCTCRENVDLEDDNCVPCQCETCCEARGEFDEDELEEEPCFCEHCNEHREQELIDQCMEIVFNGCPNCAIEAIIDMAFNFKEVGKLEMKQDMKDFLED